MSPSTRAGEAAASAESVPSDKAASGRGSYKAVFNATSLCQQFQLFSRFYMPRAPASHTIAATMMMFQLFLRFYHHVRPVACNLVGDVLTLLEILLRGHKASIRVSWVVDGFNPS